MLDSIYLNPLLMKQNLLPTIKSSHVFSFGMSLDSLLGPEARKENIVNQKQHIKPALDQSETSLPPIEIKVEENSAASVCCGFQFYAFRKFLK